MATTSADIAVLRRVSRQKRQRDDNEGNRDLEDAPAAKRFKPDQAAPVKDEDIREVPAGEVIGSFSNARSCNSLHSRDLDDRKKRTDDADTTEFWKQKYIQLKRQDVKLKKEHDDLKEEFNDTSAIITQIVQSDIDLSRDETVAQRSAQPYEVAQLREQLRTEKQAHTQTRIDAAVARVEIPKIKQTLNNLESSVGRLSFYNSQLEEKLKTERQNHRESRSEIRSLKESLEKTRLSTKRPKTSTAKGIEINYSSLPTEGFSESDVLAALTSIVNGHRTK